MHGKLSNTETFLVRNRVEKDKIVLERNTRSTIKTFIFTNNSCMNGKLSNTGSFLVMAVTQKKKKKSTYLRVWLFHQEDWTGCMENPFASSNGSGQRIIVKDIRLEKFQVLRLFQSLQVDILRII